MIVLGIDPGVDTAMVVRERDRLLAHLCLEDLDLDQRLEHSIDLVVTTAADLARSQTDATAVLGGFTVAVEGAKAPNAHHGGKLSMIDPAPIIGTAHLVGALVAALAARIIPPGGHGDKIPAGTPPKVARRILESLYPAELIGPRETTGRSKTPRQHMRSAWDVAGAAAATLRNQPLNLR